MLLELGSAPLPPARECFRRLSQRGSTASIADDSTGRYPDME
jgi:hypothetical protein